MSLCAFTSLNVHYPYSDIEAMERSLQEPQIARNQIWFDAVKAGGYKVCRTTGDGNCLLYSVQDQLKHHRMGEHTVEELRILATKNMKETLEEMGRSQTELLFDDAKIPFDEDYEKRRDAYIEEMKKPRKYLDEAAVICLSKELGITIEVFGVGKTTKKLFTLSTPESPTTGQKFSIIFSGGNHYDSLHSADCVCGECKLSLN